MKAIKGAPPSTALRNLELGVTQRGRRSASHLVRTAIPFPDACTACAQGLTACPWCDDGPRSDSAVKQILLTMNEKQSFIIEDLDDHHVVIKADEEWRVRRELEDEVRARLAPAANVWLRPKLRPSWRRIRTIRSELL